MADEHRPPRLRSVSFDPDLPDPAADGGRFDPVDPDVGFMRRVVRAALAPLAVGVVPAPAPAPTPPAPTPVTGEAPAASASALPAPVAVAASCADRS